jgi:AraC-like DNA-binding protein
MHERDTPWPGEFRIDGYDLPGFDFDITDTLSDPGLAVRWAGRELLEDGRVIATSNYPYTQIGFCIQGEHKIEESGRTISIEPGMAFWIRSNCDSVRTVVQGTRPVNLLVMAVGNELETWWDQNIASNVGAIRFASPHLVESIMMAVMDEGRFETPYKEVNCAYLVRALLNRIAYELQLSTEESPTAKATYRRCRRYICAHYSTIRSLAQVAEACEISIPYLCRLFENYASTSPYELLAQMRLRKAAMMLATSKMPVTSVAKAVGYRDIPHFSRLFRSKFGVPPSKYRFASKEGRGQLK